MIVVFIVLFSLGSSDLKPSEDPEEIFKAIKEGTIFLPYCSRLTFKSLLQKFCYDILSLSTGDEDALNQLAVHPETLSRVDERGWIPLHEAAVQDNKRILEITFSGIKVTIKVYFTTLTFLFTYLQIVLDFSITIGCSPVPHS